MHLGDLGPDFNAFNLHDGDLTNGEGGDQISILAQCSIGVSYHYQ